MNNMKQMIHNKFTNLGGKLRLDKSSDSDSLALPQYIESLYLSCKIDKDVYNELYKKMSTVCIQNYSVSDDKKMKKNSWETLSALLLDSEKKYSDDTLIRDVMDTSIKTLDDLSRNTKEFEKTLSVNVIKYFHELAEDNTVANTKKSLTSLSKDLKSNAEKVQNLQDQLNMQPNESSLYRKSAEISNLASAESKLVSAQMVEETTEKEWENKKDFYLTKLFNAESEKFTSAEKIREFFEEYLNYFTECQKILAKSIPNFTETLERNRYIYAFHAPLEKHLAVTNRKLSYVLETCIQELDKEDTLQHEGLFRISGAKSKMELLKSSLNVMRVDEFITKGCDSSVYAGVLKQYLRELPYPLMTFELYEKWCEVGVKIRQNNFESAMSLAKDCLQQLPPCYYDNLAYLMQFLKKISAYESVNKMSASNLGLMLGPNLIRSNQTSDNEDNEASVMMILGSPGGSVLEFMIAHFSELFPDAPVYPTAPRAAIKSPDVSVSPIDLNASLKKTRQTNDTDSVSSIDIVIDDSLYSIGAESCDSQRSDYSLKSPRDVPVKLTPLRKAPAPPHPPSSKPYIIESEPDTCTDLISLRADSRPAVKKRQSKLEKSTSDPCKDTEDGQSRRVMSMVPSSRPPATPPSVPTKKPTVATPASLDSTDRPTRPDNPPRRPSNPPPPVPPFQRLKDSLDHKATPTPDRPNSRKSSLRDESEVVTLHPHPSSDVAKTNF